MGTPVTLPISQFATRDGILRVMSLSLRRRRQPTARTGDIVVARVDDEATVKRLKMRGRRAELHPANDAYPVLKPAPDELALLGKVIEIRRSLEGQ